MKLIGALIEMAVSAVVLVLSLAGMAVMGAGTLVATAIALLTLMLLAIPFVAFIGLLLML